MPSPAGRRQKRSGQQPEGADRRPAPQEAAPLPGGGAAEHDVPVPRDFGRDGISGLVTPDRALRAREVSRPRPEDEAEAAAGAEAMLRRLGPRSR